MTQVEEVGCIYKRVKKARGRRKSFDFERLPAIKKPGPNGSVLLHPALQAELVSTVRPSFITRVLAEGVTVQLLTEESKAHPPAPVVRRNDGSAQYSQLCIGIGKHACVGAKF